MKKAASGVRDRLPGQTAGACRAGRWGGREEPNTCVGWRECQRRPTVREGALPARRRRIPPGRVAGWRVEITVVYLASK